MSRKGLLGAAALIAALTVASRIVGFGRIVVFSWAVGYTDLGTIYQAANTIPNIIFEIVAGGAMASLVVPLVAGFVAKGDRSSVSETASALLTWTLVLLVPLAIVVALAAGPIIEFLSASPPPAMAAVGARMLRVFAPQLPLYAVSIILSGVLQAHRRFGWPALAPLLSSLTVATAYALFAVVDSRGAPISAVTRSGELMLSVGTTTGVAVLSLCLLIPLRGLGVKLRPTFRFPAEAGRRVRGLALAGAVTVGAQQLVVALVIYLATPPAPEGTLVVYTIAQALYLAVWAVLAMPIATSAYPGLAEAGARDGPAFRDTLARASRALVLLSLLGVTLLVATAQPAATVLGLLAARNPSVDAITAGIVGFAPGLLGYGLFALLSRALYARGDTTVAAGVTVVGWAAVAVATLGAVALAGPARRVLALAVGNSVGMTVLGAMLLVAVASRAGRGAFVGLGRAGVAGLLGLAAGATMGVAASRLLAELAGTPGVLTTVGHGMLSGVLGVIGFVGVTAVVDRRDAGVLLARLRRRRARQSIEEKVS